MYTLNWENGHDVWKERWYTLLSKVSLQVNFYITCEDQAFVANMVVPNPTGETMATNVINWLIGAIAKLITIARICKFKGFLRGTIARICKFKGFIRGTIAWICKFEGFIRGTILFGWPWRCMAHPNMIWIISSRSVFVYFTIDDRKIIYPCIFVFNFSNYVLVLLFNVL